MPARISPALAIGVLLASPAAAQDWSGFTLGFSAGATSANTTTTGPGSICFEYAAGSGSASCAPSGVVTSATADGAATGGAAYYEKITGSGVVASGSAVSEGSEFAASGGAAVATPIGGLSIGASDAGDAALLSGDAGNAGAVHGGLSGGFAASGALSASASGVISGEGPGTFAGGSVSGAGAGQLPDLDPLAAALVSQTGGDASPVPDVLVDVIEGLPQGGIAAVGNGAFALDTGGTFVTDGGTIGNLRGGVAASGGIGLSDASLGGGLDLVPSLGEINGSIGGGLDFDVGDATAAGVMTTQNGAELGGAASVETHPTSTRTLLRGTIEDPDVGATASSSYARGDIQSLETIADTASETSFNDGYRASAYSETASSGLIGSSQEAGSAAQYKGASASEETNLETGLTGNSAETSSAAAIAGGPQADTTTVIFTDIAADRYVASATSRAASGATEAIGFAIRAIDDFGFNSDQMLQGYSLGATAGYDYQFDGGLVIGAHGDVAFFGSEASVDSSYAFGDFQTTRSIGLKTDLMGSARVRIGYALDEGLIEKGWLEEGHGVMPYVTAGVGFMDYEISVDSTVANGGAAAFSEGVSEKFEGMEISPVIGGGLAYRTPFGMVVSAEGLYYAFENETDISAASPFDDAPQSVSIDGAYEVRLKFGLKLD